MFPISGYQAQAAEFRAAADRVLARKDEQETLEALGFTALEQGQVRHIGQVDGVAFHLAIPSRSKAMTYVHEVSGAEYTTRDLQVWLVDSREHPGFHTVTLFGMFHGLGALVEVEGWDDNVSLADALEGSEYLEAQGLKLTVTGPNGNMLAY